MWGEYMPNITIKDIAAAAGVSHPTVSKALNHAPGVSEETRQRILKIAEQLHYVPNAAARRLANHRNRSIGLIWPQVEGLFFYHLCTRLQQEASRRGIHVVISMSEPAAALRTFREHFIDFAIAWCFPNWTPQLEFVKERELYAGEVVLVGGGQMEHTASVLINREAALRKALSYLSGLGHRRIAYIGEKDVKYDAFLKGILDNQLDYHPSRLITVESLYYASVSANYTELHQKFSALWTGTEQPTAVFLDSQDTAFGLLPVLYQLGIRIPQDLSIISYDDIPELSVYPAALTTCGPSIDMIISALLDLYEEYDHTPGQVLPSQTVEPILVERSSTAKIK